MIMQSQRYSVKGFTLLEVLVAMTIVGLGVVTLLQIFSLGLRLGSRSSASTEAITYGAQTMDELLSRRKLLEGSEAGTVGGEVRWKASVQAAPLPPQSLDLASSWEIREVTLETTVLDGARHRRFEFKTFRLAKKGNP
jgi:prepilin-type N-terminal cleavage/methylation domain-containing protein